MERRKYGKYEVSILGTGLFQPQGMSRELNADEYVAALKRALGLGVNFVDLGFPQCWNGDASLIRACGKCLDVAPNIVTVLNVNVYAISTSEDLSAEIKNVLALYGLTRSTYIQMYGVDRVTWRKLNDSGIIEHAKELIRGGLAEGLVCYFTDDRFYLKPILESCVFDAISLEYSFMDIARNPGSLKVSKNFGLGIAARGVTKDGRLTEDLPTSVEAVWSRNPEHTPTEWILGIVWDRPEISTAIVDILTVKQAEEYCSYAEKWVTADQDITGLILAKQVSDIYHIKRRIRCVMCRGCMPCPLGIDAPRIAELYNEHFMYGNVEIPALQYKLERHNAKLCAGCMKCARACPRLFPLHKIITEADSAFSDYN